MDSSEYTFAIFFVILMFIVGILVGTNVNQAIWEIKSVEAGKAQYNQQTGGWEWK